MLQKLFYYLFVVGLLFRDVDAKAAIAAVIFGTLLYAFFVFVWAPFHYIHMMCITLFSCVGLALLVNRFVFGKPIQLVDRKSLV